MIKYFHELSQKEFQGLVDKKYTYEQLDKDYPQPEWCNYPNATHGMMGCWSLVLTLIKDQDSCKNCDMNKDYKGDQDE